MSRGITKSEVNSIAYKIVGCAIEVHTHLGPGLLESIYHECLVDELVRSGMYVNSKIPVPIKYKDKDLGYPLVLDILVNNLIIIEIKAVEVVHPVHKAQLLSYLRLSDKPKGILINFHTEKLVNGITHIASEKFKTFEDDEKGFIVSN